MRFTTFLLLLVALPCAHGQDQEFRVYTQHPRLLLTRQRLRLLKLERERQTPRWVNFDQALKGSPRLPEPGFALALYYAVSGDVDDGKRAVEWALSPAGNDLRQVALVYDWCQPILALKDSNALRAKVRELIAKRTGDDVAAERDRIFGWITIAPEALVGAQHVEEAPLKSAVEQWWRKSYAESLAGGHTSPPLPSIYPLLEILHAIRDNLKIDLRNLQSSYFAYLPKLLVFGNYPAPYEGPENEFRIPMDNVLAAANSEMPNLKQAALARSAGLAMVAYDTNDLANQFLQGWLTKDAFSMMTSFGAPYEFLWADPYQPGLSYYQLPLMLHDEKSGALFVRSSWADNADWFGLYGGTAELFHAGRVTELTLNTAGESAPHAVHIGDATVVTGRLPLKFSIEGGAVLVIGLKSDQPYLIETDDEEMRELTADQAGTLVLQYPASRRAGVRIHAESEGRNGKSGS